MKKSRFTEEQIVFALKQAEMVRRISRIFDLPIPLGPEIILICVG
ncbi:Uncharacterised protein [Serratia quinivorans]|jgi:hypothetical protein|nr:MULTISPECIES: hypothetical protein [Serratia]CAI1537255.1 Uncharacterised protein [Serratia quinivorans]CAI1727046.1 Uncharacterised protein [Serratia quinivorans]